MGVNSLMGTVFSGLSALVVEDVMDDGDEVVVTARTRDVAVPCPVCRTPVLGVDGFEGGDDRPLDGFAQGVGGGCSRWAPSVVVLGVRKSPSWSPLSVVRSIRSFSGKSRSVTTGSVPSLDCMIGTRIFDPSRMSAAVP
ncbi:hypothetical protein SSAG_00949 [Streptomyces sp. Mg1]|uniref:hypothetical protein n=1 Tax=Streptomyces TaxID=1883 RepID=UPI00017E8586|nr:MULTISPECIES: hypothetical protein [unclassified Streptomyces]EDX21158.1 hypothetical protein SSAG_00949 [Streptomyces sp. Mg1]WSY02563.1 hypothetical protein OG590_00210 [Streptomyces goshikiensis]